MNKISLIEGGIGFFGFPVLDIFEMFLFFRFLHTKSLVFRFWYPLRFSVFPFSWSDSVFGFLLIERRFFGFCLFACLVLRPRRLDHYSRQFFGFERFLLRFFGFDGHFGRFSSL